METIESIISGTNENSAVSESLTRARSIGLPTKRVEDWKFFAVDRYIQEVEKGDKPSYGHSEINFVETESEISLELPYNLEEEKEFESPDGLSISIRITDDSKHALNTLQDAEFFPVLNHAFGHYEILVRVERNQEIEKPLRIGWKGLSGNLGHMAIAKTQVVCEDNSSLKIIESHNRSANDNLIVNALFKADLSSGAKLEINQLQAFGKKDLFVGYHHITQKRDSTFTSNLFSLSGGKVRNNHQISLEESGAESFLNGLFTPGAGEIIDNHTIVDHMVPRCTSDENYKGIISDKGIGVFNGKIFVRQDAQKTLAFQSNKNILLGKNPTIHTKPQLEIWADDVKCTHGATTGKLDSEQLFYLKSRGIDENEAERMLTRGFANEILNKVSLQGFRKEVEIHLDRILERSND